MRNAHKPDWLYELLPAIYGISGILTLSVLRNPMGIFSGAMLILAGVTVHYLRRRYRRQAAESVMLAPAAGDSGFIEITWRDRFNSGHEVIDAQHRALFHTANILVQAIEDRSSKAAISGLMQELITDTETHFATEETLLREVAPAIVETHAISHARLLKEVREIAERYSADSASPRELIGFLVHDVIANHLAKEDTRFFKSGAQATLSA